MSRRRTTRAFSKARAEFFEAGVVADAAGDPAADCWICKGRIDYAAPPGSSDLSHELDHYFPVSSHPELQHDPANFRHSHRRCNRSRGAGAPDGDLGDRIPRWW